MTMGCDFLRSANTWSTRPIVGAGTIKLYVAATAMPAIQWTTDPPCPNKGFGPVAQIGRLQ